mmetsp:Transcript_27805/g.52407  ORF Transcript_27805/g.52407 Transcript_27805/m.52407 type:complete len:111 (+) Transcript_27805:401-733(+)
MESKMPPSAGAEEHEVVSSNLNLNRRFSKFLRHGSPLGNHHPWINNVSKKSMCCTPQFQIMNVLYVYFPSISHSRVFPSTYDGKQSIELRIAWRFLIRSFLFSCPALNPP